MPLATSPERSPRRVHGQQSSTVIVEVARRLATSTRIDEPAAVGATVETMAFSKARPVLRSPCSEPHPKWVLGRSGLGRDTRV